MRPTPFTPSHVTSVGGTKNRPAVRLRVMNLYPERSVRASTTKTRIRRLWARDRHRQPRRNQAVRVSERASGVAKNALRSTGSARWGRRLDVRRPNDTWKTRMPGESDVRGDANATTRRASVVFKRSLATGGATGHAVGGGEKKRVVRKIINADEAAEVRVRGEACAREAGEGGERAARPRDDRRGSPFHHDGGVLKKAVKKRNASSEVLASPSAGHARRHVTGTSSAAAAARTAARRPRRRRLRGRRQGGC